MTEHKFIPQKDEDGTESVFKGYVLISVPKYKERLKLIRELSFKTDAEGNVVASKDEQMDFAEKLFDLAVKHVKEVKLSHKALGNIGSLDELEAYEEGTALIHKIANTVMTGVKLGKS